MRLDAQLGTRIWSSFVQRESLGAGLLKPGGALVQSVSGAPLRRPAKIESRLPGIGGAFSRSRQLAKSPSAEICLYCSQLAVCRHLALVSVIRTRQVTKRQLSAMTKAGPRAGFGPRGPIRRGQAWLCKAVSVKLRTPCARHFLSRDAAERSPSGPQRLQLDLRWRPPVSTAASEKRVWRVTMAVLAHASPSGVCPAKLQRGWLAARALASWCILMTNALHWPLRQGGITPGYYYSWRTSARLVRSPQRCSQVVSCFLGGFYYYYSCSLSLSSGPLWL